MPPPVPPPAQPSGNGSPTLNYSALTPKTWSVGSLLYTRWGLISVFMWILWGDLVFVLCEKVFPMSMPFQLARLGIPKAYIAIMMGTLTQIISIPMNPYLSFRSDRHRSKWGRRIPYIFKTTVPLAICLAALGFTDEIGAYIKDAQWIKDIHLNPTSVMIGVLAVMIFMFDYFNIFINTIYWYLFADVIPRPVMGRFTACFRITTQLAGSLFGFLVRSYIETQTKYVYLGAAALYLIGFSLMCWKVREGDYPPPKDIGPDDHWFIRFFRTIGVYFKECFRHPLYITYYITNSLIRIADAAMIGAPFFYRQYLHITQTQLGYFEGFFGLAMMVIAFPFGWLVDKIHPMRATLISMACGIPLCFLGIYMNSFTYYVLWFAIRAPFTQLGSAAEQPLHVSLMPRKQYGQFASANGMVRSFSMLFFAIAGGYFINYFDLKLGPRGDGFAFAWLGIVQSLAFGAMFVTYLFWRKYGGENFSYDPELDLSNVLPAQRGFPVVQNLTAEVEGIVPEIDDQDLAPLVPDNSKDPAPK